jgi:hypothetical protein
MATMDAIERDGDCEHINHQLVVSVVTIVIMHVTLCPPHQYHHRVELLALLLVVAMAVGTSHPSYLHNYSYCSNHYVNKFIVSVTTNINH